MTGTRAPKPLNIPLLCEYLEYDLTSKSCLRWIKIPRPAIRVGDEAGCIDGSGRYWVVGLGGRLHKASRVVYALCTGVDPAPLQIDHIDRNTKNNDISNIRLATSRENCQNRKSKSKYGVGVYWHKRRKLFYSKILLNGVDTYLGSWATPEEAAAAYQKALCAAV